MAGLYTDKNFILIDAEFTNGSEVIKELGGRVLKKGLISAEFIDSVLAREVEFPTGLEMAIPIAIPHIGENCYKSFLSLAVLKSNVLFKSMDGSGKQLPVKLVFLFGITNPEDQVVILKKFIFAFRNKVNAEKILQEKNPDKVINLLNSILDNCLLMEA